MCFFKSLGLFSLVILNFSILNGCMLGPDFESPQPPSVTNYTNSSLPEKTVSIKTIKDPSSISQHFEFGQKVDAKWWELFKSAELNFLIEKGLANSPTIIAAKAALIQAQEILNAQAGTVLYPAARLNIAAQKLHGTAPIHLAGEINQYNLYNSTLNISYNLDLFGGARRGLESYAAEADYQRFQFEATYLTLTTNIATTAIRSASLSTQIEQVNKLIKLQDEQVNITKKRQQLGSISNIEVLAQQTQLSQLKALLPPLEQNWQQTRHALSVLVGDTPDKNNDPDIKLVDLKLPSKLPVSLPSTLVRQRPDIRASEELLHVTSAKIGVALANFYPNINLNVEYGLQAIVFKDLFNSKQLLWTIGSALKQSIFSGGSLNAQYRASLAAFDQAKAEYEQVVLNAFKNVADSLRAIQYDAESLQAQTNIEINADKTFKLVNSQYKLGGTSYLDVLYAQTQYQQAVLQRIKAQEARYNDTIALFQALGGGWWEKAEKSRKNIT